MRAADQDARAACRPRARPRSQRGCVSRRRRRHSASRSAPWPTAPRQIRPRAGAAITPGDRRAVLDQRDVDGVFVEAGQEFARAVERIDENEAPSRSRHRPRRRRFLRHHRQRPAAAAASPSRMTASDASSAAVTGERSALSRRFRSRRGTARMAAAARDAIARQAVEQASTISRFARHQNPRSASGWSRDLSHRLLTLDARIA